MPYTVTRHAQPIDHFRIHEVCVPGYATIPASWTSDRAHAAVDVVFSTAERPYRTAWQYEAEIHNLKGQLDAIAKERNDLRVLKDKDEKEHALGRIIADIVSPGSHKMLRDDVIHAVRALKEAYDYTLKHYREWLKVGDYIRANDLAFENGEQYSDVVLRYLQRIVKGELRTDQAQKAMQQDNENLKKMVDDWRVKAANADRFEAVAVRLINAINNNDWHSGPIMAVERVGKEAEAHAMKLRDLHQFLQDKLWAPNKGPDAIHAIKQRIVVLLNVEKARQGTIPPTSAPTPEQDQRTGAAFRALSASLGADKAVNVLCLIASVLDARGYGDGH